MTWKEWCEAHATMFGLSSPADRAMVASWPAVFDGKGVTPDEAAEASVWLAQHDPPSYRQAHLRALQTRLEAMKSPAPMRESSEAPDASQCKLCGGVGMVSVPKPSAFDAGKYGTAVVLCRCPLGLWILRDQRDRYPRMEPPKEVFDTLAHYEEIVPHWRDMLAEMKARRMRDLEAARLARHVDDTQGMIARMAMPRTFEQAIGKARGANQ